ncbi:MAG: hypothetical protein MI757_13450 [Pirellulales bacterium]|nr:hypothetical protein [Pirellulales bacterium]
MLCTLFAQAIDLALVVWSSLGILAAVGLLAAMSPGCFRRLCGQSDQWIDTDKLLEPLNRRIDVDQHVMPFCRVLGIAVVGAAVLIGYLYVNF